MSTSWEMLDWAGRALRLVPHEDRRILVSPPRLVARFLRFAGVRHAGLAGHERADAIEARDPELVTLVLDLFRLLGRFYFRLEVEGVDNVPAKGPALLVGNHNGGLLPSDGFLTALAIHDRYGKSRALYALVHDFILEDEVLRSYAQRLGMLRASQGSARRAFDAGHMVLVYPGSDLDAFRPFSERGRVVLGGRKGFLKLALRAGVPIVPVVSAGTHEQLVVLSRGDRLAKALHAHAWARTEVLPIVLALPWGLTSGFVPYIPLPAQTTIAFGAPIAWPDLGPEAAEDAAVLERCYVEVEARMQAMLDELSRGRRFLLGRRRFASARRSVWGTRPDRLAEDARPLRAEVLDERRVVGGGHRVPLGGKGVEELHLGGGEPLARL
jgi:1-acyl-sn-glycerol-3-phosphate acyltransferase